MIIDRAAVAKSTRRTLSDDDPVQEQCKRWDEYLAPLNKLNAAERLRKVFCDPMLGGKVIAGETY